MCPSKHISYNHNQQKHRRGSFPPIIPVSLALDLHCCTSRSLNPNSPRQATWDRGCRSRIPPCLSWASRKCCPTRQGRRLSSGLSCLLVRTREVQSVCSVRVKTDLNYVCKHRSNPLGKVARLLEGVPYIERGMQNSGLTAPSGEGQGQAVPCVQPAERARAKQQEQVRPFEQYVLQN